MIYLWEKMSSKQRDRFHFSSLFLAVKTSERKSQFHSFSSFVSKDRHPATGKQRTWVHERGSTVTCSLVWASCNTILLLQQNMVLQPLLRNSEVLLNLHSGTYTNLDRDITCGNISWKWLLVFHMSELEKLKPSHLTVLGLVKWTNDGTQYQGLLVPLAMHTGQLVSGSVILGFPLTEWLCLRTLLGFCAQASPWCLLRSSCQLPPSSFPGFRKAKQ